MIHRKYFTSQIHWGKRKPTLHRLAQSHEYVHVRHDGEAGEHSSIAVPASAIAFGGTRCRPHNESNPVVATELMHALQRVCHSGTAANQQGRHNGA
jgi:hypothetical protein